MDRLTNDQIKDLLRSHVVISESGCWEWQKYVARGGYGKIKVNGKAYQAHRLSYEVFRFPIPTGLLACHSCDNRRCINPYHIFLGTYSDNMEDARRKGRMPVAKHPSYTAYLAGCRCDGCKRCNSDTANKGYRKREAESPVLLNARKIKIPIKLTKDGVDFTFNTQSEVLSFIGLKSHASFRNVRKGISDTISGYKVQYLTEKQNV